MTVDADLIDADLPPHDPVSTFGTFAKTSSPHPPRILILYGSLRDKSFSRYLAEECGRVLTAFGAEVRTFDPRGIAAEAGVSYGSVQHHFPTKQRLWSALVEEVLVPAHRAARAGASEDDIRRVLTDRVRARVEAAVLRPGLSAAILTDTSEGAEARLDELAAALQADRAFELVRLRALIAAGQLRAVDEVAVAAVLGIALTTLSSAKPAMAALLGLDMDDAGSRERLARGIADLLLHGLLPR